MAQSMTRLLLNNFYTDKAYGNVKQVGGNEFRCAISFIIAII